MTVYVDPLMVAGVDNAVTRRHGQTWCHLTADTIEELHEFAKKLGLRQEWFQNHRFMPHYDLVPSKRRKAVSMGAIEISTVESGRRVTEARKRLGSDQA